MRNVLIALMLLLTLASLTTCATIPVSQRADVRRDAYLRSHRELRPSVADAIAKGHVLVGMDAEQVRAVLGKPVQSSVFRKSTTLTEVWLYPAVRLHQGIIHTDGGSMYRLVLVNDRLAVVEAFLRSHHAASAHCSHRDPHWCAGNRQRARERSVQDRGQSALLTFSPSEFSQVRGQYRRTHFGDRDRVANEFLFQLLFTIGAHGAHAF